MRKILLLFMMLALAVFSVTVFGAEHPQLKAFAVAKEGMARFVIVLPHKGREEENDFKVEIFPGMVMPTDGVNLMNLDVRIESRPLKGWGYTYYEVIGSNKTMSTLIAIPEGSREIMAFVSGASRLIRYNSRLPIVVYAPKGHEIRYRIWKTTRTMTQAETN